MAVAVMQVGIVRVLVNDRKVHMAVRVRLANRVTGPVPMPMMLVVHVAMFVIERFVSVLVLMPLGEVQIQPDPHQ